MNRTQSSEPRPGSEWIVGGGEMGRLIRAMDWSSTPLGPIASWPQSLRTTVNLCLASDLPICIIWGPEQVQLYNDSYRVICGEKHPRSMGQNFPECWREAWPVIGAAHDSALAGNTAFLENQHIFLERHGYTEECFFTFSFSPIRDETGRLAGLFHPVIEMTLSVLGERRTRTLRDLASGVSNARSVEDAFTLSTETLSEYPLDLPFLLIYRLDETEQQARLVAATGLASGTKGAPEIVPLDASAAWPLGEVFRAGEAMAVDDVAARFGDFPAGPFPESIAAAVLLPITTPGAERPMAIMVAGLSPRLRPNDMYRVFHDLLSGAIATAVVNAGAYDAERNRAEALAKIDHMKTAFFANVSHEFRTPLTLMLGPLEDALDDARAPLAGAQHERLKTAHRNSLRLLKLVNTLLDFSRIEAGRVHANLVATDLAELTADLAAGFRSACEKAGLRLVVDCPPLPEPAVVDRDMWEKIVLNLISNAFKFTFEGVIAVQLRPTADGRAAELVVRDSGVGIPAQEIPRLFDRFHRIEGQKSRSFEGSGIGLALVQDLVRQHGGTVCAESAVGQGTSFTVTIPFRAANLPAQPIAAGPSGSALVSRTESYVQEALRWVPEGAGDAGARPEGASGLPRSADADPQGHVLLADDNADMRDYLRRLLESRWSVEAVSDGQAALEAVRRRKPDLLLTDVMMPGLDGFALLREIRADPALRDLPVILLSARAGEEAQVEGLDAGADDYLIKPFSARELFARVAANLTLARVRREASDALSQRTAQFEILLNEAPLGVYLVDANFRIREVNPTARLVFGDIPDLIGRDLDEVIHILWLKDYADEVAARFRHTLETGEPHIEPERVETRRDHGASEYYAWQLNRLPLPDGGYGVVCYFQDISALVLARQGIAESEIVLRNLNATLEQRVVEAVVERSKAEEQLRQAQKMEAIGQLTGGIAHDFNNLLTIIRSSVDLLRKRDLPEDRRRRYIDAIGDTADRAAILTGQLLAFARRQPLRAEVFDAAEIAQQAVEMLRTVVGTRISVVLDVHCDACFVDADLNQFETALINMVVNARDAMSGAGELTVSVRPAARSPATRGQPVVEGDCVAVLIRDTGSGIGAGDLDKIFEPFFTTKEVGKGTGLGLSQVYGFAQQSKGEVRVESTVGHGSTFTLYLPKATRAPAEIDKRPRRTAVGQAVQGRILIVEDNAQVGELAAQLLKDLGYVTTWVGDSESALKTLEMHPEGFDLVFSDVVMPGAMNGVDLARELKRRFPKLPVVLTTGYSDVLANEGAAGFELLRKPYSVAALSHLMRRMMA